MVFENLNFSHAVFIAILNLPEFFLKVDRSLFVYELTIVLEVLIFLPLKHFIVVSETLLKIYKETVENDITCIYTMVSGVKSYSQFWVFHYQKLKSF